MAYIGQTLTEGTRRVYTYTATASQTDFNAVYGVGAVDVYQNGVLLAPADYTATTGTTVVLGTGAALDDEITIVCHNTFSVADTLTASQGGAFNAALEVNADFTVDTDTLYVDSTNDRVGIGTSSIDSNAKLAVSNNGAEGLEIRANSTNIELFAYNRSAATYEPLVYNGLSHEWRNSNGNVATIDSSGNVGIGTDSPTNKLTTKSSSSYGGLDLYETSANYRHTVGVRGNTLDLIANRDNTDSAGDIRFHVGGTSTEKMIITRDGNVGIGTLQPSRPLTIQGSSEVLRVTSSGATDSHTDFHIDGNEFSIRIDDDNVRGSSVFTLDIDADEKMRIDSYGDMALGSTTAYSTLFVKGGSGSATKKNLTTFGTSNLGGSDPDLDTASIVLGSYGGRTATAGNYIAGIAFDHLLNHQTTLPYNYGQNPHAWLGLKMWDFPGYERASLVFATRQDTGGATDKTIERMEITPYGNVGINRSSPPTTLTVNGTQRIEIDSNPSGYFSEGASMHRDGALVFPVTASATTQTGNNGGGWASMGWATTARSGEQMHRNTTARYANGGSGTAMGFYIEAGTGEAGGICLDEDSVQVYGSSDNGTTFRIIDKDADLVVAEMLQTSWNWNVRGSVNASSGMSSISDQRLKKGFQDVSSDGILDSFSDLQLKSYIRVDTYDYMKNKYEDEEELREVGFVAQEVEQVFPDCVGTTPIVDPRGMDSVWEEIGEELTEIKNVNVNQLLYKTMQTVQVLIEENKALKARVEALES